MMSCLEVVTYQLKQGVSKESYMNYVKKLQEMVAGLEGFIHREVFYNHTSEEWIEVVGWDNKEAAAKAEKVLMQEPCMLEGMGLINEATLKLQYYDKVL
ncbi:hypothetical protein [Brevibacillus sp. SYSU BS000544]|uniref:hypothetical protein n=1 Tax=Brevibacillus sp. SYSU BS000544 TaxID=3416443 RepID=UPI003CE49037